VERLREDNGRAKKIGAVLQGMPYVGELRPVQANIVIFDVKPPYTAASFLEKLAARGVKAAPFGPQTLRFVTHLDFTEEMLEEVVELLKGLE